ncbi:type II toxin-antitoxin system VapB family antitoxin [Leptospira levettii]|uniref:Type II toxin-antitoxin system VapB family antitoxin n=1 Tax=Leptospira levettii TaxID=2023178 RepID=A0AAW5VFM5_9LEPT|nr:type II toxin-antitoxin system VapB family antitoxin [Leptospira levettii]MCW7467642.1 type II toxin-antitoxin system VapB family antitoxin [Leptospira levettii]MCW7513322.1 type II toxin-antitoxin system VapB family antitoxin [Leptospira levettii]MCW7517045.1 type II toxin-antitoxin system VapB family antitoxin [Leptospira levettii]
MRTTVEIPEELLIEAMKLTEITTKTEVIKEGLRALIRREKIKDLKKFKGKIDLDIQLKKLRNRRINLS